jgi:PhnB protein
MAIQAYVNFSGNCREAVEYYVKVFKTKEPKIMTYDEMPPDPDFDVSEEIKKWVLHTSLDISGSTVMFSDVFPGMPLVVGNNISLTIITDDEAEIRDAFDQLKEEGRVDMELGETFWSKCYGSVEDKFGIIWQFDLDSGESF